MIVIRGLGSNLIVTQGYGSLAPYIAEILLRDYIRQLLIDDVTAALQTISVANGYSTNAGRNIHRKFLTPSRIDRSRTPHLSVCDGGEHTEYGVDDTIESVFTIKLYGVVDDTRNPHKKMNKVIGDIKKALLFDQERNDLANSTMIVYSDADEGTLVSPTRSFFTVDCRINYSHTLTAP